MKDKKCFISYAHSDSDAVRENIMPILRELGIDYWIDKNEIFRGENFFELILRGIKRADFILAYFNSNSNYVNFEMGSAIGLNKPVIILLNDKHSYPSDIRNFHCIYYKENNFPELRYALKRAIQIILENVIDKLDIALNSDRKLIGIQVGTISRDYVEELRITADLICLLEELSGRYLQVEQTSKGSLKSLLSIDFESLTKLVEKIIFIIPELKKRKAENFKIEAETRKINAETEDQITETKIKQANALLDIIERSQKIGLKLQLADELLMLNNYDILRIKEPEIQNKNNYR